MEKINFGYSTKNIPMPSETEYVKRFIEKTQQLLRQMRWKANFFFNPTDISTKETYGFKSRKLPKQVTELKPFEDDMLTNIGAFCLRMRENCSVRLQMADLLGGCEFCHGFYEKYGLNFCSISQNSC